LLLAVSETDSNLFNVESALKKFNEAHALRDWEEKDKNALKECFVKHSKLINEIKTQTDLNIPEFSYELYLVVSENLDEAGVQNIAAQMQHLDKAVWDNEFKDDTHLTALVLALKQKHEGFSLGHPYYDALHSFAEGWCQGSANPSKWETTNWDALVNVMGKSFYTQFTRNLTITFWHNLDKAPYAFFTSNKNHMELGQILENGVPLIQSTLESSLQNDGEFERIKMLADILQTDQSNVFRVEDHFPDFIKEPFNKLFSKIDNSEQKELLELIATKFQIQIEEPEEQAAENADSSTEEKS
jgi:hypothetical protein